MATVAELYGAVHEEFASDAPQQPVLVARRADGFTRRVGDIGFLTGGRITNDMGASPDDPAWLVRFSDGEQDAYFSEELDVLRTTEAIEAARASAPTHDCGHDGCGILCEDEK